MSLDNGARSSTEKHAFSIGTPVDLVEGILNAGIESPWNGFAELVHLPVVHEVDGYNHNSLLGAAGGLVGTVGDFVALNRGADLGLAAAGKLGLTDSVLGSAIKAGGIGTFYGGVLTPGNHRIQDAITNGVMFGVMSGTAQKFGGPEGQQWAAKLRLGDLGGIKGVAKIGLVSGAVGGFASVLTGSVLNGQLESPGKFIGTTTKYAAFGALFGVASNAADDAFGNIMNRPTSGQSSARERATAQAGPKLTPHETRLPNTAADPELLASLGDARMGEQEPSAIAKERGFEQMNQTINLGSQQVELSAATVAGTADKPNEDSFSHAESYSVKSTDDGRVAAAIFDGTSNLKPITGLVGQTGAHFASNFLADNFSMADADRPTEELMLDLNERLLKASLQYEGVTRDDGESLPASTGTIVKIDPEANRLTFAHVSDSWAIAYFDDGTSALLTNNTNGKFDDEIFELGAQIARDQHMSNRDAMSSPMVKEAMMRQRVGKNNNPNGQGTGLLNGDPNVRYYIQTGAVPLDHISAVLLGTDGLVPQGWSLDSAADRQRVLEEINRGGLARVIDLKHESEEADPNWNHIRYKQSDDATGLLLRL